MYWFIVDLALVIVIVITVAVSAYRGFLSSLIRLLGVAVAIVAGIIVSRVLAEPIFNAWFREGLIDSVSEKISTAVSVEDLVKTIEGGFLGILIGVFGDGSKLADFVKDLTVLDHQKIAVAVVDGVVKEPVESLIALVLFLITFVLVVVVVAILVKVTGVLNTVPIIGGLNRILGALLGIVYGFGICYLLVILVAFFFLITGNWEFYSKNIQSNTIFFSWLYRYNPIIR